MNIIEYNKESMIIKMIRYAGDWILRYFDNTIAALLKDCLAEDSYLSGDQPLSLTCKYLNDLVAKKVKESTPTPESPAYVAHAVTMTVILVCTAYSIGVLFLTFYCCPRIYSRSKKDLAEEEFTDDKLNVFIDQEMNPLLKAIETQLSTEDKKEDKRNRSMTEMMKMLKVKIDKIQDILNDVKSQRNQVIDGDEKCTSFQISSVVGAVFAVTGCFILAVLDMEVSSAGTLIIFIVGMIGVAGAGYTSKKTKRNYQKSLQIIDEVEERAREAEKVLTALHTKVQIEYLKS